MKKMTYNTFFGLVISLIMTSCGLLHDINRPDEGETKYSSIYPISGEWFVKSPGEDYFLLSTYNTVADDGINIWFTIDKEGKKLRAKVPCNVQTLTFGSPDPFVSTYEDADTLQVIVFSGKIIKNVSLQPSETKADSIWVDMSSQKLEVDTLKNGTYRRDTLVGYRRTGFLEDEH